MTRLLCTALLVLPLPTRAQLLKLDFGTADSPVREGFTRITNKTELKGDARAAWLTKGELTSKDAPVNAEWTYSESSGRNNPPAIYTSDLTQDHVEGAEPTTLRLKATDGAYHLWLLCGFPGGHASQVWDIAVAAGTAAASATFPGAHTSRVLEIPTAVIDGALEVHFTTRSRWLVSALILCPDAEWAKVKQDTIDGIERDTFLLPAEVLEKDWQHRPHVDDTPLPKFTDEEQERGFALYHRHYLDPIWPNTVPLRRECDPTLRAYAARHEYEPLTFTLFPLQDLDDVHAEVTDLVSAGGEAIAGEDIDVRYVRYMWVRPNYRTFGTYYRAPDVLMPMSPQSLTEHENWRVWLTVYSDAFARDGVYKGEARVLSGEKQLAAVPIVFRVLPFELQKDRSLIYAQYYHHPYRNMSNAPDAFSRRWWRCKAELEHADMAAHGNNGLTMGVWSPAPRDGKWQFSFDFLAQCIDLYRRHGFYQPIPLSIPTSSIYNQYFPEGMGSHLRLIKMPPKPFFDQLTDMVRVIEEERKRRQWPEFLYYPVDEPSTSQPSVEFMTEVLKAIKEVPGVRTYVTADPMHEQFAPMRPYLDVWCCQPFNPDRDTIVKDMAERGVEYWCYPNHVAGENDHTPVAGARMTYGFGFWRSGFRALIPWIYQATMSDPWNYLDGGAMDFFNRTGDDGEPIPVALWEAYREGIDDGRYLTTLDRWIDRAKRAGLTDAVKEAEGERQFVWDAIDVQTKYKYDDLWDPEAFDVYRWVIANQILKLRAAVER